MQNSKKAYLKIAAKQLKGVLPVSVRLKIKYLIGSWIAKSFSAERKPWENLPWGVNMFGSTGGASGLSEASRGVVCGLRASGVPVEVCDLARGEKNHVAPYQINILHINPDQLPKLLLSQPKENWLHRYNIGFWVWEQEELPREWMKFLPLFDEIWTPSNFSAKAIQRETTLPVKVVPHLVQPVCEENWGRREFGLPENIFLCLIAFDCDSVVERKNPEGAIRAYQKAFTDQRESVGLIIKARNLTKDVREKLTGLLAGWPNITIIDGNYSKERTNSLIRLADVYLSLHRSEGFGLFLAEAMYLGTPVIATNWSGNTDFMSGKTACLVDAKIVKLKHDHLPFRKGSRWAEPNVEQAAEYLKQLYQEPMLRQEIAKKAEGDIKERLGIISISKIISGDILTIKESAFPKEE